VVLPAAKHEPEVGISTSKKVPVFIDVADGVVVVIGRGLNAATLNDGIEGVATAYGTHVLVSFFTQRHLVSPLAKLIVTFSFHSTVSVVGFLQSVLMRTFTCAGVGVCATDEHDARIVAMIKSVGFIDTPVRL